MKKLDAGTKKIVLLSSVFLLVMAIITVIAWPYMRKLAEPETQAQFAELVGRLGIWGWLMVLGIQMVQIVIAFIPGEPVELIAGVLYGAWGGLFICLAGCVLASSVIFMLTKKFGVPLLSKFFKDKEMKEYSFLQNSKKLDTIVFILFLVPATPKDMLTYIVGASPMKLHRFLLISTFARIPSIISSTFMGATMRQGEWVTTLIIFVITALIGILGIKYKDNLLDFVKHMGQRLHRHREE